MSPSLFASLTTRRAVSRNDLVDHAVLECLVGCEPAVAIAVGEDPLHGLPGVLRGELGHQVAGLRELLGLDRDVDRVPLHRAKRLVHEDAAVRLRVALPGRARDEQELRHRRREPEAHGRDVTPQGLHRVVDREAGVDLAAGRVEVERHGPVGIVGLEDQQLGAHPLGDLAVDHAGEHHPPLVEHPP